MATTTTSNRNETQLDHFVTSDLARNSRRADDAIAPSSCTAETTAKIRAGLPPLSKVARASSFALLCVLAASTSARAQCTAGWSTQFSRAGLDDQGTTALLFDDGSGTDLYVGGQFLSVQGVLASHIARFDGSTWSPLGDGMDGEVRTLVAYDENGTSKLFAAGTFSTAGSVAASSIARWDGAAWTPLGSGLVGVPNASAVYSTTAGSQLYVGGSISSAGGIAVNNVAMWDGASWSPVGSGFDGVVEAMVVHDTDGAGPNPPELFVAGESSTNELLRWDGSQWTSFPGPFDFAPTRSLLSYTPPGGGAPLLVAGLDTQETGLTAWAWDGTSWTALFGLASPTTSETIESLVAFDAGDGSGNLIYAAHGGAIQRWTGDKWIDVGHMGTTSHGITRVQQLVSGAGAGSSTSLLYSVGRFPGYDGALVVSANVAKWPGLPASLGSGGQGIDGQVQFLAVHDDGNGAALYAGGSFLSAGSTPTRSRVLRRTGSGWTPLEPSVDGILNGLVSFDDGHGPALYTFGDLFLAGPDQSCDVRRWNGGAWTIPGPGLFCTGTFKINAACAFDDGSGPALYVGGGAFTIGPGGPTATLAKWDGNVWTPIAGVATSDRITELHVYDDGSGSALYVAGSFSSVDGVPALNIAKWSGTTWSALGVGVDHRVRAFTTVDFGSGPELVAAGQFTHAGGQSAPHIARWNGAQWSAMGSGIDSTVGAVTTYDDGNGPVLIAGSALTPTLDASAPLLAWNGTAWMPFAGGTNDGVLALQPFDDGTGMSLYVGGQFTLAGGIPSSAIARYDGCSFVGVPFCFGDGSGTPCPCANHSPVGDQRGCSNSFGRSAALSAYGVASVANDSAALSVRDVPAATCLLFQGSLRVNGGFGDANGDGLSCAGGDLLRIKMRPANASGVFTYPMSGEIALHAKGAVLFPGTRTYQVMYRNAQAFCTPATFNYSNGYELNWAP